MATAAAPSQRSSKRASLVKSKNAEQDMRKDQLLQVSNWGTTFAGEMAPYGAPRGAIAGFLFRWRLWFECTFVFTLLEPWEKGLLLVIAAIIFTLIAEGIFKYLPMHLVFVYQRATYYLLGNESVSGFGLGALAL